MTITEVIYVFEIYVSVKYNQKRSNNNSTYVYLDLQTFLVYKKYV